MDDSDNISTDDVGTDDVGTDDVDEDDVDEDDASKNAETSTEGQTPKTDADQSKHDDGKDVDSKTVAQQGAAVFAGRTLGLTPAADLIEEVSSSEGDLATSKSDEKTSKSSKADTKKQAPSSSTAKEKISAEDSEETASVVKSTATMSMATLLSRLTGFVRTWACAFALGNTILSSAYQVANNLPNMLFELVAGGILTTAFLPVYVSQLKNQGEEGAGKFAGNLMSMGLIVLGVIALLATFFAPQIVYTQTFMADQEKVELAVYFFRFFAIQIVFYGMGAIISGILNSHKKFMWPALGPVFNNIVVIITMVLFVVISDSNSGLAMCILGVGTSLGVAAMLAVQVPALISLKVPIKFHIDLHDPALKETIKLALPATIFVIVNLVVVSVRNSFSLYVTDNGPSTLSYAWLWYQFPYGVLAVALSTAMLTEMSAAAAVKDWPLFRRNVKSGLSGTIFLILPLAALMVCLAEPLCALYYAGKFTADDITAVSQVLQYWSLSLPFYAGYMYLYRAFSAMKTLGLVTWIDAMGRICQATMYALFTTGALSGIGFLPDNALLGIPIADLIFYAVMFFVLCIILRKKVGSFGFMSVMSSAGRTLIAAVIVQVLVTLAVNMLPGDYTIWGALIEVIVLGCAGMGVFYLLAKLFRVPETQLIGDAVNRVKNKLLRRGRA